MAKALDRPDQKSTVHAVDQTEVISWLDDASHYSNAVAEVERIETHGAIVFLAGDDAYKLKRAVKLPYMDFSTLGKREQACRHEVERNQPAAPDIYVGVKPVTRQDNGGLAIDGDGAPVDWLVHMKRFDQHDLLDNLARNHELDLSLMPAVADCVAAYHRTAVPQFEIDGDENLAKVITQIIAAYHAAGNLIDQQSVRRFSSQIITCLNAQSGLLRKRAKSGHVRLCHGDLHLRNIFLLNGRPTLFDAIEFDDAMATIDVLYDLAFLLMDLWHRGLRAHANLCFNHYVSNCMSTNDLEGLSVVPVFLATRAGVRSIVSIDRRAALPAGDRERASRDAHDYFELASEFLGASTPVLVAVGGLSGSGKSTLAAQLAPGLGRAPGALHLRSDVERKRMFGCDPLEQLPTQGYTEAATEKVYRRLCRRAEIALMAGQSVIVDAVFLQPAHRRWIEQIAARTGRAFLGLWLDADIEQLLERVTLRTNDASDADATIVRQQTAIFRQSTGWTAVDASGARESTLASAGRAISVRFSSHRPLPSH
ncbi:MAG: AAA family ATPase [Hyphomicrobiaceae bacterium]